MASKEKKPTVESRTALVYCADWLLEPLRRERASLPGITITFKSAGKRFMVMDQGRSIHARAIA
jgi:hypothetical protein